MEYRFNVSKDSPDDGTGCKRKFLASYSIIFTSAFEGAMLSLFDFSFQ